MNILFISDLLSYGGASKLLYDLIPLFVSKDHKCKLFILKEDNNSKYLNELRAKNITIDVLPSSVKSHFGIIKYLINYINSNSFDIIHANLFPVIYYVAIVKRLMKKTCPPILMTEHSTDNRRRHIFFLKPLERFIYDSYSHVISISKPTQDLLQKWIGCQKYSERFSVIENGIDINRFLMAKAYSKVSIYPDYKKGDILIGMVGRFTSAKNHTKMLEALSLLPIKYKLILVGEGELESFVKAKTKELGIVSRVFFLGFRKDIPEIMKTIDLLCIPSKWEGFGLIAVEAAVCKTPIVCSEVPGLSEIVDNCALKFNPNSSKEIANSILKLENIDLKNELVDKNYERVSRFDINKVADNYLNLFEKLLNNKVEIK